MFINPKFAIKTGTLFLTMCILLSTVSSIVFSESAEIEDRYRIVIIGEIEALEDTVTGVFSMHPTLADGTEISIEQYKSLLEESELSKETYSERINYLNSMGLEIDVSPQFAIRYYEQAWGTFFGDPDELSAWYGCPGPPNTLSCELTAQFTQTYTESWDVGVEAGWKSIIKGSASYSWASSASTGLTYKSPIPPGYAGKIIFKPLIAYTAGTIETDIQTYYARGEGPLALSSGEADGIYTVDLMVLP